MTISCDLVVRIGLLFWWWWFFLNIFCVSFKIVNTFCQTTDSGRRDLWKITKPNVWNYSIRFLHDNKYSNKETGLKQSSRLNVFKKICILLL